jgi:hypothetical protein
MAHKAICAIRGSKGRKSYLVVVDASFSHIAVMWYIGAGLLT